MAWLIVSLKLRSLRNALRGSRRAKISFILSTTLAAVVAVTVFASLAGLRGHGAAVDEATAVFTTFAFGWLVLPIFAFGLDATLDPATLALYPLRTRPLAMGLLACLGHRGLAAGQRARPARGDRRAGRAGPACSSRRSRCCCRFCSASPWPGS